MSSSEFYFYLNLTEDSKPKGIVEIPVNIPLPQEIFIARRRIYNKKIIIALKYWNHFLPACFNVRWHLISCYET